MTDRANFRLREILPVAIPAATALVGVWLGGVVTARSIERSIPLQFRTEQVVSAYAQYIATGSAPEATADTAAGLRRAKAVIAAYGSADVIGAVAGIQASLDAIQAARRVAIAEAIRSAIVSVATPDTLMHLAQATTIVSATGTREIADALDRVQAVVIQSVRTAPEGQRPDATDNAAAATDELVTAVAAMVTTYGHFGRANDIISGAGSTEVVNTLARLDSAITAALQLPPVLAQEDQLNRAVDNAIVSAIAAMRSHVGEEAVPRADLERIFQIS